MNIEKLPKWAQEHIRCLQGQRDMAVRTLNDFCDNQTPSAIYTEQGACTGEGRGPVMKRQYVQSHKITIEHAGVCLDVLCRETGIDISWSDPTRTMREIAMVPEASQKCRLVNKENMR